MRLIIIQALEELFPGQLRLYVQVNLELILNALRHNRFLQAHGGIAGVGVRAVTGFNTAVIAAYHLPAIGIALRHALVGIIGARILRLHTRGRRFPHRRQAYRRISVVLIFLGKRILFHDRVFVGCAQLSV